MKSEYSSKTEDPYIPLTACYKVRSRKVDDLINHTTKNKRNRDMILQDASHFMKFLEELN